MRNLLRIQLFGLPQISFTDLAPDDLSAQKAKHLFFYLVLFRHTAHTRSELGSLFWGDRTEARARHSLNTALWRLRRWLEPLQPDPTSYLLIEDGQVSFNTASQYWLDTHEFEDRVNWGKQMNSVAPENAAAAMTRAIEIYQGELLEGCYADWCMRERDRLHQMFLQALVQLMVYHGTHGAYSQAIALAKQILDEDPLREDVQRELMRLFTLNHQPAEALLQYRRCEVVLREELGIAPMSETKELLQRLVTVAGSVSPATTLGANLTDRSEPRFGSILQKMHGALLQFDAAREELIQVMQTVSTLEELSLTRRESQSR